MSTPDPRSLVGETIAGKYRVQRVLGQGGMGVVLAAWHLELEQLVAIKFVSPSVAERAESAVRLRREARALAKIRSEHTVRILDFGVLDGSLPFLVMELLEGVDLAEELTLRATLPVVEAVGYLLQAIDAIAQAHESEIVHRDLKPGNLFLARRPDGSRTVKVLDFGISKSLSFTPSDEMSLTQTDTLMGSPFYMSPEQMSSAKEVDARTDVWSLGAILYEMLTGRTPFVGESLPELCSALASEQPPPIAAFRDDVPLELEQAVLGCLAKDRRLRVATVSELGRLLAPFADTTHPDHAQANAARATPATRSSSGPRAPSRDAAPSESQRQRRAPTVQGSASSAAKRGSVTPKRFARARVLQVAAAAFVLLCVTLCALRAGHSAAASAVGSALPSLGFAPATAGGLPGAAEIPVETLDRAVPASVAGPSPLATARAEPIRRTRHPAAPSRRNEVSGFGGRR